MRHIEIIFIVAVLFIWGCDNSLNFIPEDDISQESYWKTASDFELAANNCYKMLPKFNMDDLYSDIAFSDPNTTSNGDLTLDVQSDLWDDSYSNIRNCNIILERGEDATDEDIKRYVAEGRFFRALNYWLMFKSYGGVPLIKESLDTDENENLYASRASRSETVDFIINDLEEAAGNLPEQNELSADTEFGRITKGAAYSLMARVALFEGTWQKFRENMTEANEYLDIAISAANTVITSGQYSLFAVDNLSYFNLFLEDGEYGTENILDRLYKRQISVNSFPFDVIYESYNPTKKLADMYLDINGLPIEKSTVFEGYDTYSSEFNNRDPRMTQTFFIPGTVYPRTQYPDGVENWPDTPNRNPSTGYICKKWTSSDYTGNSSGTDVGFNFSYRFIRYAEILLIYAEAKYERNGSISDGDLDLTINKIRDRVQMPGLTNAFVEANGLDMREEIRRERTVELALEGFRYDDLRRWKTAEDELPENIRGIKIRNGSAWGSKSPYSGSSYDDLADEEGFLISEDNRKFTADRDYLKNIPTEQIDLYYQHGYTLEQNPNW